MKIAAAQIACTLGDLAANTRKLCDFAERAKTAGAELVVFPEMSDTGYAMQVIREQAKPWSEGAVPELQKIARRLSLAIVSGVSEKEGDAIFNSQVVIDSTGTIVTKYRKTHLFAPIDEDKCCTAGDTLVSFDFGPLKFGLTICYDLRFPEIYRALAVDQGQIFSSFPPPGRFRGWNINASWPLRARSKTKATSCSRTALGKMTGCRFAVPRPSSIPTGVVVAAASADREELVVAEASPEMIDAVRARMPVFAHRRARPLRPASRLIAFVFLGQAQRKRSAPSGRILESRPRSGRIPACLRESSRAAVFGAWLCSAPRSPSFSRC